MEPYNAGDSKSVKRAQKAAKQAELERRTVVVTLMSDAAGRAWIWQQLSDAHIFSNVYDDNQGRMAFLVGERNRGLALLAEVMQWAPEQFIQAMREANERRTQSESQSESTTGEQSGGEEPGREFEGPESESESQSES